MIVILTALVLCSGLKALPTTSSAADVTEAASESTTEPIPGADETSPASIESTPEAVETTQGLASSGPAVTESNTEAISNAVETTPADDQGSSNPAPSKRGPTPVAPPCAQSLCNGKSNGNYEMAGYPHDFVQCSNGIASCQSCWPQNLFFSQVCNQCLYKKEDSCYTTKSWKPQSTYPCPDVCHSKGPDFSGNIADKVSNGGAGNPFHYIGCWKGVTQGCVVCPAGLKFNEQMNSCLFDGLYQTEAN